MNSGRRIKVAQVITRLDWGGAADVLRDITLGLPVDKYEVWVVTGETKFPSLKTREFMDSLGCRLLVVPFLKREVNLFFDLIAFCRLFSIFFWQRFRLVHTHTAKAGVLGRLAAWFCRTPVIVHTPHGHNFYGYYGSFLSRCIIAAERILSWITDKIIAQTNNEKNDHAVFAGIPRGKIEVVYQGVELDGFLSIPRSAEALKHSLGIPSNSPVVGMISRIDPVKGVEYFVGAASNIARVKPDVRFLIVGEGSQRGYIEAKIKALGLKDSFVLTGWREDIPGILSLIDVLVLTSLNEAVGRVLIEAQSMGIGVVASDVGGVSEIIKDRITGFLVPAKDPASIAQALSCLLDDEILRKQMGEEGKVWVKEKFTVELMAAKVTALYGRLLVPGG